MRIRRVVVGPMETNCYVVSDGAGTALVVDPGAEAERVERALGEDDLAAILLTHSHGDHIGAVDALMRRHPDAALYSGAADAPAVSDPELNLSAAFLAPVAGPPPTVLLRGGERIAVGRLAVDVLATPGHTPGGVSYLIGGHLFSGDLLFAGDVGRVDLPGGDWETLLRSIRERVLALPDEVVVHPGHGPETTVGRERRANPYVLGELT